MAGNQPLGQLHRHDDLAQEFAGRLEAEFGTEPFTLREMIETLNPLTMHDAQVKDGAVLRRFGPGHLQRLVADGTLDYNEEKRTYQLNTLKPYEAASLISPS